MTYQLIHGDCLEEMAKLEPASVDAVIADPQYNVGIDYNSTNDRLPIDEYISFSRAWLHEAMRISRFVVVTPGVMNLSVWMNFKPVWVAPWVKLNQCSPSGLNGWNVWEPVLFFGRNHKPIGHDVFIHPIQTNQKDTGSHPCPKDLRVWRIFIDSFFNEGCTVLDPFMGSGTSGVACVRSGRNFIGIEIDKRYYDEAALRIANVAGDFMLSESERKTGQLALFEVIQ